jgi:PAS domain S-box-containing protein
VSFAAVLGFLLLVLDRAMRQQRRAILHSDFLLDRAGTILERVADGVVLSDASGRILDANPAAARIVGCHPEALRGRRCEEVLGLRSGERQLDCSNGCALLALSQAREADAGHEVWRAEPDGRRRPLLANVSAIVDDGGEVREVVHSLRDITSLKQADEAKTLFLATASHELKTPLTVIRGYGEILLHNPNLPDEVRGQAASAIVRRSSELSDIVDRLLLSSRIEAGRLQLELTAVDVASIVHERSCSLQAATGRMVDVDMPSDVPSAVGDGAAVTTVLDHLLDNAVKYSPGGEPVDVWVAADDGQLHLRVTDQGIGMDPEQASHCFDKFWQAESTDVRRFRGTGIGLYVVASLVEAMGGAVGLVTAPGQGTSFTVSLLRSDVAAPIESAGSGDREPGQGENSIVREFMRQIGVLETRR